MRVRSSQLTEELAELCDVSTRGVELAHSIERRVASVRGAELLYAAREFEARIRLFEASSCIQRAKPVLSRLAQRGRK
jgi:hypothetical protein